MANSMLTKMVDEISAKIKGDEEDFKITLFQSGDDLMIPVTDDLKWGAKEGGDGKANAKRRTPVPNGKYPGEDEEEELEMEGYNPYGGNEETEGGEGQKHGGGDDGGDGDEQDDSQDDGGDDEQQDDDGGDNEQKLGIGSPVRIKGTGREGIITGINDDGTFVVSEKPEK